MIRLSEEAVFQVARRIDPPDARLDDCTTQRNLDEAGRAQAARIGQAFRKNGIVVGRVRSSPRCRCRPRRRRTT